MYTQRNAIGFLFSVLILSSCQTQKNNDHSLKAASPEVNNAIVHILPEAAIQLSEYANAFAKSIVQQFVIIHKKKTVITAKGGLKVTVDPAVLEKEDGSAVDGKINVSIIELTNSNDLFKANTATISDGRLLASGGSYFIGMECNGQKLKVKQSKTIEVGFPALKKEEMELFYGERDGNKDMNWKTTGVVLKQQFNTYTPFDDIPATTQDVPEVIADFIPGRLFRSMDAPAYYYKTKMTLKELVDTLNSTSAKVYVETISFWPKNLRTDIKLDTNYLISIYGPQKQYILRSYKALKKEQEKLEKKKEMREEIIQNLITPSASKQLAKYYAPANISNLGWINCDRLYESPQTEVNLDLPITLNNTRLEYFIIFRSFNGMVKGYIDHYGQTPAIIANMPVGEKVTLVAFAKNKGIIYQVKEDFIIERRKRLSPGFRSISPEEMSNIFEKNGRI